MEYLLITESPAKAKKIQGFLSNKYIVRASCGHICDLDKKQLSIDVDNDFKPTYKPLKDKKDVIQELKRHAKGRTVILAADDDREGEAIAWHCSTILKLKKNENNRIVYREISKKAILNALDNPKSLNTNEINAQQARRIIDRLIGFKLSPCLWKHIQCQEKGLSAGRVQSALLNLLHERDEYIKNYQPDIQLTINGQFDNLEKAEFTFLKDVDINDNFVNSFLELLSKNRVFLVKSSKETKEKDYPPKPLITSSLQKSAQTELGFNVSKTMMLAQKLYEQGHITYMRTDSTFISEDFQDKINRYVDSTFEPNLFKKPSSKKVKGAQEAHEAIRPTNLIKQELDGEQMKLYNLIFKKTITSHMKPAEYKVTTLTLHNSEIDYGVFISKHKICEDLGYLRYSKKEAPQKDIVINESYNLKECHTSEKENVKPNEYNESDIVQLLEKTGIGRPSTYASIISTVGNRRYTKHETVSKEDREEKTFMLTNDNQISKSIKKIPGKQLKQRIILTQLGKKVLNYLRENFMRIIQKEFTSKVENDLDLVAQGTLDWIETIRKVYLSFIDIVEMQLKSSSQKYMKQLGVVKGKTISIGTGKYGPYLQVVDDKGDKRNKSISSYLELINKSDTELSLDEAVQFLKYPKKITNDIDIYIGPYGYYLKHKGRNYKINQSGQYSREYCESVINK